MGDNSFWGGALIACAIYACIFFIMDENKKAIVDKEEKVQVEAKEEAKTNPLTQIETEYNLRKAEQNKHLQKFEEKIIYNYSDNYSRKGDFTFTTGGMDTVFLIRAKNSNSIMAIVALPKESHTKVILPFGEYGVDYAVGEGGWYGLERFWGNSTQFFRSNTEHSIHEYQNTGIRMNAPTGVQPDRINQRKFIEVNQ